MEGYRLFRRERQGRQGGDVALYVRERFDCTALTVSDDVAESLCVRIRWMGNKGDAVGVYYLSPRQDFSTDESFCRQLGEISASVALVLMSYSAVMSRSWNFLKSIGGNFMSQVLSEPGRKDTLLDLLFVNREGLGGGVMVGGYGGHSDHEMVEFKIFSVMRKKDSRVASLNFRRANFKLLQELFSRAPWESAFEGLRVHRCWSVFKNLLLEAQEQAIPLCRKSNQWGRRPTCLNRELFMEMKRKKKWCDLWKRGQALQEGYRAVVYYMQGEDTKGQNSIRELKLASVVSDNKIVSDNKKYINSRRESEENVGLILVEDGLSYD